MNKKEIIDGLKDLKREAEYLIRSDKDHDEIFDHDATVLSAAIELIEKYYEEEEEWFGQVRWCEDDLKAALEAQGYPVTENNIAKLYALCDRHWFTDRMIEAGWEYIYDNIGYGEGWDEEE